MSADNADSEKKVIMMMFCCAGCGIAEVDDIKLMQCAACDLVRYCSYGCQKYHMPQHKKDCKKRAAELRYEILFKQPESSDDGDCPICLLPLPIDSRKTILTGCCSKVICDGCNFAYIMRECQGSKAPICPFCRHLTDMSKEEYRRNLMKRIEANDPEAMSHKGFDCESEGDYISAFGYYSKATELGYVEAHFSLSGLYREGQGVEKDEKKEVHHLEEAAIGGHPKARHNLGFVELINGRDARAVKHLIIAANLGDDMSVDLLKLCYRDGLVSKDDFAAALRGHQAAADATKSPQMEAAEAFRKLGF